MKWSWLIAVAGVGAAIYFWKRAETASFLPAGSTNPDFEDVPPGSDTPAIVPQPGAPVLMTAPSATLGAVSVYVPRDPWRQGVIDAANAYAAAAASGRHWWPGVARAADALSRSAIERTGAELKFLLLFISVPPPRCPIRGDVRACSEYQTARVATAQARQALIDAINTPVVIR